MYLEKEWIGSWQSLPGFLINIVFATLFIGSPLPSPKQVLVKSGLTSSALLRLLII